MRSVNRRETDQQGARIVDEVLASGEPVEVVTRGEGSVVISRKAQSTYEEWLRLGLTTPGTGRLDQAPRVDIPLDVAELRRSVDSDH